MYLEYGLLSRLVPEFESTATELDRSFKMMPDLAEIEVRYHGVIEVKNQLLCLLTSHWDDDLLVAAVHGDDEMLAFVEMELELFMHAQRYVGARKTPIEARKPLPPLDGPMTRLAFKRRSDVEEQRSQNILNAAKAEKNKLKRLCQFIMGPDIPTICVDEIQRMRQRYYDDNLHLFAGTFGWQEAPCVDGIRRQMLRYPCFFVFATQSERYAAMRSLVSAMEGVKDEIRESVIPPPRAVDGMTFRAQLALIWRTYTSTLEHPLHPPSPFAEAGNYGPIGDLRLDVDVCTLLCLEVQNWAFVYLKLLAFGMGLDPRLGQRSQINLLELNTVDTIMNMVLS